MKKFGLFMTIALLFAFAGCSNDDTEDTVVATVAKPVLAVSENTPSSFGVEWEAVEKAAAYLYAVTVCDAAGNETEFRPMTQTDQTSLLFADADAGMKYTVRVKALAEADSQLSDSDYAEVFIETPAEGLSAQSFTFTVEPAGYDSATVRVKPAIADESYYFAVVKNSSLLDKTNNAIVEMLKKEIDPASLVKGERTIETKWLDPETAYVAVAFGYDADKGTSTSLLSRSEKFTTAADPRMSIALSMQSVGDETIAVRCVPSDAAASYYVTALKAADVAGMSDRAILEAELEALNARIAQSGWDAVAADNFRKGAGSYNAAGLSVGTEYCVVAFGVAKSASGKAEETTRLFTAKAKTTSPVAVVDFSYRIEDGNKYVSYDPDFAGKAAWFVSMIPNKATVKYAYGLFNEKILEMAEEDVVAYMTGDPANMQTEAITDGTLAVEWGTVLYALTVGVNSLGETGPLSITRVEITKDGQDGGTTTPVERGDASVGLDYRVVDGSIMDPQYAGYPTLVLQFKPDSKCVDYRWLDFLKVGVVGQFGEDALLEVLMDDSLKYDGSNTQDMAWYDRSMTEEDIWGMVYKPTLLGESYDIVAVALDAEGRAGKVTDVTIEYPTSLEGSAAASVRIPSSVMFSRATKLRSTVALLEHPRVFKSLK